MIDALRRRPSVKVACGQVSPSDFYNPLEVRSVTARVLRSLIPTFVTPLILVACQGTDSTGPGPTLVWTSVPSAASQRLFGVWGSSASDVWAVGYETLVHYNGTAWSSVTPSLTGTGQVLRSVWGTSASNVWAVGYDSPAFTAKILHYNGASWSTVASGTTNPLVSVWGSSASDVWAVGDLGTIVHYDGTTWSSVSTVASAASDYLRAVWGSSRSDVWAAGGSCLYHYNGTNWSAVAGPGGGNAIWGTSLSDVWVASGSATLHYNGSTWSTIPDGRSAPESPSGIWGTSASNVWAVTTTGTNGVCCGGKNLDDRGNAWSPGGIGASDLFPLSRSSRSAVLGVGEPGHV